jgi:Ca-activated chloride channel family protein
MKVPTINLIPLREAVSSDSPTTLDVLVRIIPPEPEIELERPALNIGLVIDRSGSMQGKKWSMLVKRLAMPSSNSCPLTE